MASECLSEQPTRRLAELIEADEPLSLIDFLTEQPQIPGIYQEVQEVVASNVDFVELNFADLPLRKVLRIRNTGVLRHAGQ